MDLMDLNCYNSRLEINLSRIQANIEKIKAYVSGPDIIPVVKSNAYGFGTAVLANFLVRQCHVRLLAVARVFEACQILDSGCDGAEIMILGPVPEYSIPVVVQRRLQMPLFREQDARLLSREAKKQGIGTVKVQLKIETGMNRIGVRPGRELADLIRYVKTLDNIEIEGVFTHFATADQANEGAGNDFTREQFERFKNALSQLHDLGISPRYVHCCNTGATTWLREAREISTHVRTGSLYLGYSSIQDDWNPIGVRESGSWKTVIVNLRDIVPGESVGYGRAFRPDRPARVAVIGIGYGDGYLRSFAVSGKASALISGVRCPFVSTCMDMSFLDVTGVDCRVGDEVTLFGEDGKGNRISGLETGHLMGETRLAMFSHITERVARTYSTDDGATYRCEKDFRKTFCQEDSPMKYNFTDCTPRMDTGSGKWNEMKNYQIKNPEEVVPFSVADMEFPIAPEIREGLKKYLDTYVPGYANPTSAYFDAVCRWQRERHGWEILPQWIMSAPGIVNAFHNAVQFLTKPGEGVLLLTPTYYPMYNAVTANGRALVESPLRLVNGRYEIDFEDFQQKAADLNTKLFILCNPQNPTSRVFTREELTQMGEICMKAGVFVCSDEIHGDIVMEGHTHIPFASIREDFADRTMTCIAASKTFNLAGFQTSAVVIKNQAMREAFHRHQMTTEINPKCNILGYEATRLAYEYGKDWYQEMLSVIAGNAKLVTDFCREHLPGIRIIPLEGTYLLWMDFRSYGIEGRKLAEILKAEANLFFDDGYIFGESGEGFERWNLAAPRRFIEAGLRRLSAVMKPYEEERK